MDRPVARRWGYVATLFTLLALVVATTGCTKALATAMYLINGGNQPAAYDGLKDKKVAVVCRPLVGLSYRDSNVAKDLARHVSSLLKVNVKKIKLVDQAKVAAWIDEHSWEDYLQVGKALKADMIVGIDLEQFGIYEGQTVYQGKARVGLRVYDCKTKELVFEKDLPPVVYPPNHAVSSAEVQESDFRKEYLGVLAECLAVHFYPHDPNINFAMDAMALH
ncbi:MAG: hypothetical protein ABFD16_02430 [Thermoguttaceae bacterium]|jgi:hypothetical protein